MLRLDIIVGALHQQVGFFLDGRILVGSAVGIYIRIHRVFKGRYRCVQVGIFKHTQVLRGDGQAIPILMYFSS